MTFSPTGIPGGKKQTRWKDVPCDHPDCDLVMRRDRWRKYLSNRCRKHMPRQKPSAETRAKIAAGLKLLAVTRPEVIADRTRKSAAGLRKRLRQDPELRTRYEQHARQMGQEHGGDIPGVDRTKVAAKSSATRLAAIPYAYRDAYRAMGRTTKLPAADRRRMIIEQAEVDARRHHAEKGTK